MKPHNRKLVIQSIEAFSSSAAATPSTPLPPSGPPLALEPSPIPFQSPAVLVVLVILIALFAIGCFSSCLRQLSDDSSAGSSSRRRGQRTPSSRPSDNPPRSNPRKGVDSTTIRALPVYSYCGDVEYQIHCAICLGEFEENEAVKAIPFCKHVFHPVCIDTWLLSHVTCPLCRSTRFFGSVKGGDGLGAKEERCDQGVSEYGERSTVGNCDMCIEVRTMGLCDFGVRRNKSCSSLGEGARLQRTSSF